MVGEATGSGWVVLLSPAPVHERTVFKLPCTAAISWLVPPWQSCRSLAVTFTPISVPTVMVTASVAVQPLAFSALTVYVVVFVGEATGSGTLVALSVPLFGVQFQVMPEPELAMASKGMPAASHTMVSGVTVNVKAGSTVRYTESV